MGAFRAWGPEPEKRGQKRRHEGAEGMSVPSVDLLQEQLVSGGFFGKAECLNQGQGAG